MWADIPEAFEGIFSSICSLLLLINTSFPKPTSWVLLLPAYLLHPPILGACGFFKLPDEAETEDFSGADAVKASCLCCFRVISGPNAPKQHKTLVSVPRRGGGISLNRVDQQGPPCKENLAT